MRLIAYLAIAFALALALATSVATTACSSSASTPATTGAEPATPLESSIKAGRYALTGTTVSDHCEESLVLAAKQITIDLEGKLLRADVVKRNYELEMRGSELVATGRFDPIEECGTHQYIEVWRLRPQGPDSLEGQLTTYYRGSVDRDCLRACKFVTAIKAVRMSDDEPSAVTPSDATPSDATPSDAK